jgi:F-type H+-transporting ATPase subunit b
MVIDATFWVAISFVIFIGVLIYLKIPQKINDLMNNMINAIKSEIEEAEKLKNETKKLLNDSQIKIENAHKESQKIINTTKVESEKLIIEMNEKFFQSSENRKKITDQKILQMKNNAIKDIKDASVKIAIQKLFKHQLTNQNWILFLNKILTK